MTQTIALSHLHRADGSATYSANGYSVIAAVNGPVEIQRRDELPEEAAIDVAIRPATSVGGVRERNLESIVEKTLSQIIITSAHPRTLIQVVLQVVSTPEGADKLHQSASNLPLLPALLQSSVLALLTTSLPLYATLTSVLIAISQHGEVVKNPSPKGVEEATSLHVLSFESHGELLVSQSEGAFSIDTWEQVYDKAEEICRGGSLKTTDMSEDVDMGSPDTDDLEAELKAAMRDKNSRDQRWRDVRE
ncbi:MAG: hypothetical protein Q9174_005746 [Haloplaca sp. 1 TL-2023]